MPTEVKRQKGRKVNNQKSSEGMINLKTIGLTAMLLMVLAGGSNYGWKWWQDQKALSTYTIGDLQKKAGIEAGMPQEKLARLMARFTLSDTSSICPNGGTIYATRNNRGDILETITDQNGQIRIEGDVRPDLYESGPNDPVIESSVYTATKGLSLNRLAVYGSPAEISRFNQELADPQEQLIVGQFLSDYFLTGQLPKDTSPINTLHVILEPQPEKVPLVQPPVNFGQEVRFDPAYNAYTINGVFLGILAGSNVIIPAERLAATTTVYDYENAGSWVFQAIANERMNVIALVGAKLNDPQNGIDEVDASPNECGSSVGGVLAAFTNDEALRETLLPGHRQILALISGIADTDRAISNFQK